MMNHDGMSHSLTTNVDPLPRLLNPLLNALNVLYHSVDPSTAVFSQIHHPLLVDNNVHEFLLWLQSRNVRRHIQALYQHHCDAAPNDYSPTQESVLRHVSGEVVYMGSSWSACITILCHSLAHAGAIYHNDGFFMYNTTQRMFAVQTLLHRCRRVKLVEALDWEMEDWADTANSQELLQQYVSSYMSGSSSHNPTVGSLSSKYLHCIHKINPIMGQVLTVTVGSSLTLHPQTEEQVKAKYTILSLATLSVQIALECITGDTRITPILSLTASTLATILFRWWCSCRSSASEDSTVPSLVLMIRESYLTIQLPLAHLYQVDSVYLALSVSLLCTIAALPDAVLASPGGARERLSIDPRAIQWAAADLRHSTELLFEVLQAEHHEKGDVSANSHDMIHWWILYTCERWVTYIPLNIAILSSIHPLLNTQATGGLSFLIALYESASWTMDQIISSFVGLSSLLDHSPQPTAKKKQSSRSKKRHKEIVDSKSTNDLLEEARTEMKLRGDMAYHVTLWCWPILREMANNALNSHKSPMEGEGPVYCITAGANACLPHILRYPNIVHGCDLFQCLSNVMQRFCASSNKTTRALVLEPLYTLHSVLLDVSGCLESSNMGSVLVDHFCNCTMNLASRCEYPTHYFEHLCLQSDEDLEMERKNVRDLLRTVAGSLSDAKTAGNIANDISMQVLNKLINTFKESIVRSKLQNEYIPETVAHAFSALAKPVNFLAKLFTQSDRSNDKVTHIILITVLQVLLEINQMVVNAFQNSLHYNLLLPLCRTVNIGNASYSPFLSVIATFSEEEFMNGLNKVLDVMIIGSILSLEQIPELAGPSILDHSMYDIRGTMRGPGGEDHVGCLTLMRCSFEDEQLAQRVVLSSVPYITRLCALHSQLKHFEIERGPMILHGQGVTPQTRRILLGSLCQLELLSGGQLGASVMLSGLFIAAVEGIVSMQAMLENVGESELFKMTELTLDIVAFTPAIVSMLFDINSRDTRYSTCLQVLTTTFVNGYKNCYANDALGQWTRLRAAVFALIKRSAQSTGDIPEHGGTIIIATVVAECDAIRCHCGAGSFSSNSIFVHNVVAPESVPSGLMLRALAEILMQSRMKSLQNTVNVLSTVKYPVLEVICHSCSDCRCNNGALIDPRPTLAEAWFQAMIALAQHPMPGLTSGKTVDPLTRESLLVETFSSIVSLLFYSSLGKTPSERAKDPGMSLDGPHSLAIMKFFTVFFQLGPSMLQLAGDQLLGIIPVSFEATEGICKNRSFLGTTIIGAALFRASQGALPPWAIESIPEVYKSLFEFALGKDVDLFCRWLRLSMELRSFSQMEHALFSVSAGQLLSGKQFENMSNQVKSSFLDEVKQLVSAEGAVSWRRLKGSIKQACGGKKKDTDFNQKPSPTRWDFDRI
jgi:hypothetical protein